MTQLTSASIGEYWASLKLNEKGLVPVITTDATTNEVLMMAWMNQEAFSKTLETKSATYFSRSRNKLWVKGQDSGNTQKVVEIRIDCDADTVLLKVEQKGVACHTGDKTCFDGVLVWSEK
jgi:phosphoribosyl-AMP cyclohydrolase